MTNSLRDGGGDVSVLNFVHLRHVEKECAYEGTVEDMMQKMEGIFFFQFLRRCGTILTADSALCCLASAHAAAPHTSRRQHPVRGLRCVDCPLKFPGADITR